jgi:beta-lactamase superfamily II metal-dependent hydrolase
MKYKISLWVMAVFVLIMHQQPVNSHQEQVRPIDNTVTQKNTAEEINFDTLDNLMVDTGIDQNIIIQKPSRAMVWIRTLTTPIVICCIALYDKVRALCAGFFV